MHLRELTRQPLGLAVCLLLATFIAVSAAYRVSLLPPGLHPHSIDIAAASTEVLVDTPHTAVLDMRQGTYEFQSMTNRAVLLGNVMASLPVREYIARRAHVPAEAIKTTTPLTPSSPRPVVGTEDQKHTSDILKSPDEYRLSIQANPTVPILNVSAEAPSAETAAALANGAVDGLRDYLTAVASAGNVAPGQQVRLKQLGRADGRVIDHGARLQIILLSFFVSLAVCCAALLFIGRVREGWAGAPRRAESAPPPTPTPEAP
jgi:hypothetical protein